MGKDRVLEQYLLDSGIVDGAQLSLAKKFQQRQQGPLLMILLQLEFISAEQLSWLWDWEAKLLAPPAATI